jgi:hypothetical protein
MFSFSNGRLSIVGFGNNTGHTQKNGAVSKEFTIDTAPFFCVCLVLFFKRLDSSAEIDAVCGGEYMCVCVCELDSSGSRYTDCRDVDRRTRVTN